MEYPDGSYTENVYDYEYGIKKLQRQLQYGNDGELVEENLYSYDDGYRLDVEYVTKQNLFIRCKYDDLNRVTPRQMILTTCGPIENEYFTYDDAGNIVESRVEKITYEKGKDPVTSVVSKNNTYNNKDNRLDSADGESCVL